MSTIWYHVDGGNHIEEEDNMVEYFFYFSNLYKYGTISWHTAIWLQCLSRISIIYQ